MSSKVFKGSIYTILFILIVIFYTKDINIFDNSSYKNIKKVINPSDILVLVNKNNILDKNYIPSDLESISLDCSNSDKFLRRDAKKSFEKLCRDAKKEGLTIIAISAFRDYNYQNKLYNEYVKEKGIDYADKCSARAGHSEHQTGLAVDVMGSNNDYDNFDKSIEFEWMINNAHKYGFILRYPKDKTTITGFKYEPWHYRYVGIKAATDIYNSDITLEEYLKR